MYCMSMSTFVVLVVPIAKLADPANSNVLVRSKGDESQLSEEFEATHVRARLSSTVPRSPKRIKKEYT